MKDWSYRRRRGSRRLGILDGIESSVENMWLNGYRDLAKLHHAILRGILRVLVDHALSLRRLRPVLLEDEFGHPLVSRTAQGLSHHTTSVRVSNTSTRRGSLIALVAKMYRQSTTNLS